VTTLRARPARSFPAPVRPTDLLRAPTGRIAGRPLLGPARFPVVRSSSRFVRGANPGKLIDETPASVLGLCYWRSQAGTQRWIIFVATPSPSVQGQEEVAPSLGLMAFPGLFQANSSVAFGKAWAVPLARANTSRSIRAKRLMLFDRRRCVLAFGNGSRLPQPRRSRLTRLRRNTAFVGPTPHRSSLV